MTSKRKPRAGKRSAKRSAHLREIGLQKATVLRYRKAVRRFFHYLSDWGRPWPNTPSQLDFELSEFINHFYQDDAPEGYAADVLSGFRRLFPQSRQALPISQSYFHNWRKTILRTRAIPLTALMVKGLAGVAYARGRPQVVAVLLLGFRALLRSDEMVHIRFDQLMWMRKGFKAIIFLKGKSRVRQNKMEKIIVDDPVVLKSVLLAQRFAHGDRIFTGQRKTADS